MPQPPLLVRFGEYLPDLPSFTNPGLIRAENALPAASGYLPLPTLSDLGLSALAEKPRGAFSTFDSAGVPWDFIGTRSKLYSAAGSLGSVTDVSRVGGYNATGQERWAFAAFGQQVFAFNFNDAGQVFTLGASSVFADLPAAAPRARHCAVIGDFLVVGNLFDSIFGTVPDSVWWSAIGNPLGWPTPGSDAATAVQSDRQQLRGDGGPVRAVIAGAEVGAIFQKDAVSRMDYRGGATVFEITRVEQTHGLLVPGFCCAYGRFVLYLAEDGFRVFDFQQSTPVGKEKIDRTFFADADLNYPESFWMVKDPDRTVIWMLYPGAGNVSGAPNKLLFYDYALNKFSAGVTDWTGLFAALAPSTASIDALPSDNLDTFEPTTSFDDAVTSLGARAMGAISVDFKLGLLTGAYDDAVFETGDQRFYPARSQLSHVRPLIQGATRVLCQVAPRSRILDDVVYRPPREIQRDGTVLLRADANYHRIRTEIRGGWTEATGLEAYCTPSGTR